MGPFFFFPSSSLFLNCLKGLIFPSFSLKYCCIKEWLLIDQSKWVRDLLPCFDIDDTVAIHPFRSMGIIVWRRDLGTLSIRLWRRKDAQTALTHTLLPWNCIHFTSACTSFKKGSTNNGHIIVFCCFCWMAHTLELTIYNEFCSVRCDAFFGIRQNTASLDTFVIVCCWFLNSRKTAVQTTWLQYKSI